MQGSEVRLVRSLGDESPSVPSLGITKQPAVGTIVGFGSNA